MTHRYSQKIARSDQALLGYFFVDRRRRPPLLCAVDLPGGLPAVGADEPQDDADHAPGGHHCTMVRPSGAPLYVAASMTCSMRTFPGRVPVFSCNLWTEISWWGSQDEAERLQSILDGFPTSETEDRQLLESKSQLDWRERLIVEWRVLRKEALRLTVAGILEALGKHAGRSQHKQPVTLISDASEDLQQPRFIQFGAATGDEL